MSTPRLLTLALFVVLLGCPTQPDVRLPSCTAPEEQDLNTLSGLIEGEAWVGATSGFQMIAGPALQVSATGPDAEGVTVNVVLRLIRATEWSLDEETDEVVTDDGADIEDVLEDAEVPYDFELGDANTHGANSTVTVTGDPSMSTGEGDGEGFARITSVGVPEGGEEGDPEEVVGCFRLLAESQDGSATVNITDAGFRLTSM